LKLFQYQNATKSSIPACHPLTSGTFNGHRTRRNQSSCVLNLHALSICSVYCSRQRGYEIHVVSLSFFLFVCTFHHHHHPRISSRRKSWNKTSGPLCVTYYTTVVMSMLLWPIVCVAVWSAEQFRFQCTLECPQRRQRRDRRRQRIPNLCCGNGEGPIADGPVQRPWNMQRRWRCRSQTPRRLRVSNFTWKLW